MQGPQFIEPECRTEEIRVGKADVVSQNIDWKVVGVGIATVSETCSLAIGARFSATAASWDAFAKGVGIACVKLTTS